MNEYSQHYIIPTTKERIAIGNLRKQQADEKDTFMKSACRFFAELHSVISIVFFVPAPKAPMCQNYGHIVEWTPACGRDSLPTCRDCGAVVSSASQLRKASPYAK